MPQKPTSLIEYMRMMVEMRASMDAAHGSPTPFEYKGMEDYVLRHGMAFTSQPLTKAERNLVLKAAECRTYRERECFYNAQFVASLLPDIFTYCEGIALAIIPTHHAWVTLNGKVVDLTWRVKGTRDRNLGTFKPPYAYHGVSFPARDWSLWWEQHGMVAVPVLDDWKAGWPILQGKPWDEVIPRRA
jgi:hypothetical protein